MNMYKPEEKLERRKVMRRSYLFNLSICIFLFLTSLARAKDISFNSVWKQAEITVDGKDSEWSGLLYYLEEEKLAIGMQNDSISLYVVLKATDKNVQVQIMRTGLTIWLDAKGKKNKNLGIHYPIGIRGYGIPEVTARPNSEFSKEQQNKFMEMLDEIEIYGPEKEVQNRIYKKNSFGIEVSINDTLGMMIYELKIPLKPKEEFPHAIAANTGDIISLGLETGEFKREMMKGNPPRGGGMPGGRGEMPPGGIPPGGRGGMPGGREGIKMSEPIKFWAEVSLAKAVVDKN